MHDLLIKNASLPDGQRGIDILIRNGDISAIGPAIYADGIPQIDAGGDLICSPFVDAHFHMDAVLSYGEPRVNESGTLLEGISLWGELKPRLTKEALISRALKYCEWAVSQGLLGIRSHVDICDASLLAVEALLEVRERMKEFIDIQLVAFPQDGLLRSSGACAQLIRALDMGVDVIGGIPHFERTMSAGAESVQILCRLAAERGLMVDMHCDESDDPLSRHIETLCEQAIHYRLQGKVAGSHLTSMHSMDNYYVSKLLPLMKESGVAAIANPLINITLQGRHDSYPKRRGMTRVPEMLDYQIPVAFGHDCVMDPWYSLGSGDMLEVASMGLHVAQLTSQKGMRACFEAVTTVPAEIMGLNQFGLRPGCEGSLVVLDAGDPVEALRLRPVRRYVIRRGRVIAKTEAPRTRLMINENTSDISRRFHD
jgi:cytosine deaminase